MAKKQLPTEPTTGEAGATADAALTTPDPATPVPTPRARPIPGVKTVQLHAGADLIASKTSLSSRDSDLYETDYGVLAVSKKTKRKVVIPYANIRGYELL